MKFFITLGLTFVLIFFITEDTISISGTKVPCSKICGDGNFECRATGIGSIEPTTRVYKKERPDGTGKTFYNLGRSNETKPFNNIYKIISLQKNEISIDTAKVDYDVKGDNLTDLMVDLEIALKKNEIEGELATEIKREYRKILENNLIVKANIITYTMSNDVIDSIRDVMDNIKRSYRYTDAYERLKGKNRPLIRQVKVIEELCTFKENKNIYSLLKPILTTKIGDNPKVDLVIKLTKEKKKTTLFNSSFKKTSIYSYGYWNDTWMYD